VASTRAIVDEIGEIVTTMQTVLDSVCSRLRKRLEVPSGDISVALVLETFKLRVEALDFGRPSLQGNRIRICGTAPPETQAYQLARAAFAYALIEMKLIRFVSPHDVAVALCGVSSGDEQVQLARAEEPPAVELRVADVHWLFEGGKKPS